MEGLGKKWKPLAVLFSTAGLVGALPVFNVNQLTQALNDIVVKPLGMYSGFQSNFIIGLLLALITAVVVLGGISRISKTASKLVPAMVVVYVVMIFIILSSYITELPGYLYLIFTDAFSAGFYEGDTFLGGIIGALILLGVRRGAFSNEAGIGTAPMAHGAAKTNEPIREGLVAMLGPAIDTLIICTLTALAILVTGVWQESSESGVSLTVNAFESGITSYGKYALLACIIVFSVSSLFSYSYYGTKCMAFLFGTKYKKVYNYIYLGSIIIGATTSLSMMINLIDTFFALMAIPTMLSTFILAPKVKEAAKLYFAKLKD
jgi:AGCS family alanine or glycine:cation symporter